MNNEDISNSIIQLAAQHRLAEDFDDAYLIELEVVQLISNYCIEKRYAVNGFPFKLIEKNIDIEDFYELDEHSVSDAYQQYISRLALEKEDVADLMWLYTKSFWPEQFDTKTEYLESTNTLLASGVIYNFNL